MPFPIRLLVLDIDNTVFDWVAYYVTAFSALLEKLSEVTHIPESRLAAEARQVFTKHRSIEYPFVIQEMPSVLDFVKEDIDKLLQKCVEPGRAAFNEAARTTLKPYPGVVQTLQSFRKSYPHIPVVALTDAPRYVAMWKLNKLGLLSYFDAVYGLSDPTIPISERHNSPMVHQEILVKHLRRESFDFAGKIRVLPEEYEKPGTKGLRMVLLDYDLLEQKSPHEEVIWIGDNLRKDVGLGLSLGVTTGWAEYGTRIDLLIKQRLFSFSPLENVHKNVALHPDSLHSPKPHFSLDSFAELLQHLVPASEG